MAVKETAMASQGSVPQQGAAVGKVTVVDVDCGHWVHVEQPEKVARQLVTALTRPW